MTYAELSTLIQSMTKEQRLCDVTIKMGDDEVFRISHIVINWYELIHTLNLPLDEDHPFLSI